jgi:hypothetical protein
MINEKKLRIAFVLAVGLIILLSITLKTIGVKRVKKQIREEYPTVGFESSLHGNITKIQKDDLNIFRANPYEARVILDDTLKVSIVADVELKQGWMLDDVIHIGEIISKEKGTDIINIWKIQNGDTLIYTFQLLDGSLYPIKKNDLSK